MGLRIAGGSTSGSSVSSGLLGFSVARGCGLVAGLLVGVGAASVARAQSMSPETLERVTRATVMVETSYSKSSKGDSPLGSGSGYFVNRTGLCVSNDHVTDPGHGKSQGEKQQIWMQYNRLTWRVTVNSGTEDEKTYEADVLYSNDQADMAIMQVLDEDGSFLETPDYLEFQPSEQVRPGDKLFNLGFPGGNRRTSDRDKHPKIENHPGTVLDKPRMPSGRMKWIYTNLLAHPGNSGGPAVNIEGKLVGTATLAGSGDSSQSGFTMLVPADLTAKAIRYALEGRKVPAGADLFPFLSVLMDDHRVYRIPLLPRSEDVTCVTMMNDNVICGSPTSDTIEWTTPLGTLPIPNRLSAYVITDEEEGYGMLLLDGGDRVRVIPDETEFSFKPVGGEAFTIRLEDVKSVTFPKPDKRPHAPPGDVFVIGGNNFNFSLKDPKGSVSFMSDSDRRLTVPVTDVTRISTIDGDTVLETSQGTRMVGQFEPHSLEGTFAWTDEPIKFSFERATSATMFRTNYEDMIRQAERPLAKALTSADSRLKRLAEMIDAGKIEESESLMKELANPDTIRSFSRSKREDAERVVAEHRLRAGKYEEAFERFKKLTNADNDDVRWHAVSRMALLERYRDGKFEGGEIHKPEVMHEAGRSMSREYVLEASRVLEEIEQATAGGQPLPRSDYAKLIRRAEEAEKFLLVAVRLSGGSSEELLVRLWRNMANLHGSEIARLQRERAELNNDNDGGRRSQAQERQLERKEQQLQNQIENTTEEYAEVEAKRSGFGFIIDDSDRPISDDI